jgi:FAD binding domain
LIEARTRRADRGAGPTGLTLACGLLANGVAARVVDKAVEPARTSRALGLQPRGIEVMERLGALDHLPERALQVEQIVVHINGRQAARVRVGQPIALVTRPGLVISQADVEAELRRRVTELGGQVVWGREVAAADADLPLSRRTIYAWLDGDTVFGAFPLPGRDERRPVAAQAVRLTGAASNLVLGNHRFARLLRDRVGRGRLPGDRRGHSGVTQAAWMPPRRGPSFPQVMFDLDAAGQSG